MDYPVIKAAANILVHAPTIMLDHGTTITLEKHNNPNSDFLNPILGLLGSSYQLHNFYFTANGCKANCNLGIPLSASQFSCNI